MKKYKISVVTGTRADYGLLRPLLLRLRENKLFELKVVITGAHLYEQFGNTQEEILSDGFTNIEKVDIPLGDDSKAAVVTATGKAIENFVELWERYIPNLLIVLGDRYEIMAATISAYFMGIAVAHISGGDVTEGAIDDAIRHSITKMSCLHFTGCEQSRRRVIQMGEQPERVFNVGELGVENCLNEQLLTMGELSKNVGFDIAKNNYAIVTFHPVTMEDNTAEEQIYELIAAMDEYKELQYIITLANADSGGQTINDIWEKEKEKHSNWYVTPSLGMLRYISAVKYAKLVIGNSSSGVIEAPALGTLTINIGDRQKGRAMAETVICCQPNKLAIQSAIRDALMTTIKDARNTDLPYGDGTTSMQIESIIVSYLENKAPNNEKEFYDIEFKI